MTLLSTAESIATELVQRIQGITVALGAETDIGLRVYQGRRNIDEDNIPCAVLIEGNDNITDRPGRAPTVSVTQQYVIGAYVDCDPDNPNVAAHKAIRDIKRALFKEDGTLGGKVRQINYLGRDIGPRADSVPVVFVTVTVSIEFVEDLTKP